VLFLDQMVLQKLVLKVHFEHLLVVFLEYRVEHVGENKLLNQLLLLVSWFLLLQRLELFLDIFLRFLDKHVPIAFFLVVFALMRCKEVVKQLNFNHVLLRYHV